MSLKTLKDQFDRYAVWSINTYRAGGLALPMMALILLLLFLPTAWGKELPTAIVLGLPLAIVAAVMIYGLKIEKRVKRRHKAEATRKGD
ncbi:MAG: hypothetical protein ACK4NZ_08430 [Tsuneonella sp.]